MEKVEEYRSTEDAMRMALLAAKKMADEMVEEAKSKTEAMLREKEAEAAMKLTDLRSRIQDEEKRLKAAQQVTAEFVDMSMGLCRKHVTFLQKLGELKVDETPFKRPDDQKDIEVVDAAKAIEDSVTKIFGDGGKSAPANTASGGDKSSSEAHDKGFEDDDEVPRQFKDLKFGDNYSEHED